MSNKNNVAVAMPKWLHGFLHFLKNMIAPDKVTWPSFSSTFKNTVAVICVCFVSAMLLILMDTLFSLLLRIPYLF